MARTRRIFSLNEAGLKRSSKPTDIGSILDDLRRSTVLGEHLEQAKVWAKWPEIVGEKTSAHTRPDHVKDGTLKVVADSPVWMHRLSYRKWEVMRRINRLARRELVSDIFFELAPDDEAPAGDG